ncbi:MAG: hypothetical protein CL811_10555 [Colwelliaceae bacterium]|nr:hypothetical protein [Colwelliaceae bacterium]|tara:strand:- start:4716 stop:5045 length:330 start_codon:yes stop_codon:yes gene_type:complete
MKKLFALTLVALILSLVAVGMSAYTFTRLKDVPKPLTVEDVTNALEKLGEQYKSPSNLIYVDNSNYQQLAESIQGLSPDFLGKFLAIYTDKLVVFDFQANAILTEVGRN